MKKVILKALLAGLVVGVLDGFAACVNAYVARGVTPIGVFRYVASGYFGKDAFSGDDSIAFLGLLFHFIIAISWTMLFFVIALRFDLLLKFRILAGLIYGLLVWLGMNLVVLPFSNITPPVYRLIPTAIMIGIHMFIIGLSISLLAGRLLKK